MTSKIQRSFEWAGNAARETVIILSAILIIELGWYRELSLFVPTWDERAFFIYN
ncbi:hypothetical protein [Liquorilactobacillus capillatus]|uniref:hypothetical protein n=1 Tax=Liquorilactobacillus capillatus TaxID=480931 RepID=UPI000AD470C7|nr:hypothetical protein [Liquorilactobacillus capillatus]